MQFFATLALAACVLAAPTSIAEKRANTALSVIESSVQSLVAATQSNVATIQQTLNSIQNDASAGVIASVQTQVAANLKAIQTALQNAATSIAGVTTGAVGGVGANAAGFTQDEITDLTNAVNQVIALVANIKATEQLVVTDLKPAAMSALGQEIAAVNTAIAPVVNPLMQFVAAVRAASASSTTDVTGLGALITGLQSILTGLLSGIL